MKRFLFVIQYDSFLSTLYPVIDQLLEHDHHCDVILLKYKRFHLGRALKNVFKAKKATWITDDILSHFNNRPRVVSSLMIYNSRQMLSRLKKNYDTVVIGTASTPIITIIKRSINKHSPTTKLVSGYVGALLSNNPKGFMRSLKRKALTDLIWVPGEEARHAILATGIVDEKKSTVAATGLPRFDQLHQRMINFKEELRQDIVFFAQPTFPKTLTERMELVSKLVQLADQNPGCNVIIKPRFKQQVEHAHAPEFLLQEILAGIPNKPDNIKISYDSIYDLFQRCKLALTISSTAGLEALLVKIPTYFLNDFCRNENLYGSDDFKIYNATTSFQALFNHTLPKIEFNRVSHRMRFDGKNTSRLLHQIITLTD